MIIATALGISLGGIVIPFEDRELSVKYHYGDQKELLLWVKSRGNLEKYPLVWYVLNRFTVVDEWYDVEARLVIMAHTKYNELNNWRASNTYVNIISPITKEVRKILSSDENIQVYSSNPRDRFMFRDEPNYGVSANNTEKTGSDKSVNIDIVDARIITFRMRIKADCIINKKN